MTIKQAIEKAIQGGWNAYSKRYGIRVRKDISLTDIYWVDFETCDCPNRCIGPEQAMRVSIYHTLLDPEFWKALGKSMGWQDSCANCGARNASSCDDADAGIVDTWWYEWHRFIDHLADGNSIESYFESLN